MISFWLSKAGLFGIKNQWWLIIIAGIAALSATLITISKNRDAALVDTGKEAGAAGAVIEGQNQTLDQLEKANAKERELQSAGERSDARYRDCMFDSRDKAACERFRPVAD